MPHFGLEDKEIESLVTLIMGVVAALAAAVAVRLARPQAARALIMARPVAAAILDSRPIAQVVTVA